MIQDYVKEEYGFSVHTAYIAKVKRSFGLPMNDAPNAVKELKNPKKHPTPEKVESIKKCFNTSWINRKWGNEKCLSMYFQIKITIQ